ncbi:unnamed protein product [Ambrosiozyma monospora]|uniref:Unnamed protein product n=1 Tax=Ambrosiozyma monospora TaxID=43982 RepID=A0ACB5T4U6_AMBMO|nr:unnamed protein product [Ambrosiozyma monospora]
MSAFALWCYAFNQYGPESSLRSTISSASSQPGSKTTPPKSITNTSSTTDFKPIDPSLASEDGAKYLRRIQSELEKKTGNSFSALDMADSEEGDLIMNKFAKVLPKIDNLNRLVGLLSYLSSIFAKCSWEPGRQYAKLLKHCAFKSMGDPDVFCTEMLDAI